MFGDGGNGKELVHANRVERRDRDNGSGPMCLTNQEAYLGNACCAGSCKLRALRSRAALWQDYTRCRAALWQDWTRFWAWLCCLVSYSASSAPRALAAVTAVTEIEVLHSRSVRTFLHHCG